MIAPAYIGLGGNVGDIEAAFDRAAAELAALPGVATVRLSSPWRTAPLGPVRDQPPFLNACAEVRWRTPPEPETLLSWLHDIERRAGRDRTREIDKGPRPLDLDFLLWGDRVRSGPQLILPHPRLHERAFALAPLCELAGPEIEIPGSGRVGDLLAAALADPRQSVTRLPWGPRAR